MFNREFALQVGISKWVFRMLGFQLHKRVVKKPLQFRLVNGVAMELPIDFSHSGEIYVTNCDLDWGSEALLLRHLDANGCFFDVGAHLGYYALLASTRVRHVYAFEPDLRALPRAFSFYERPSEA